MQANARRADHNAIVPLPFATAFDLNAQRTSWRYREAALLGAPPSVITFAMLFTPRRAAAFGVIFVVACSNARDGSPTTTAGEAKPTPDASTSVDAASTTAVVADGAADPADAAALGICVEGRRRCVGLDLQICDQGEWLSLESCLAGEWCDVAVGVCRPADAGADAE